MFSLLLLVACGGLNGSNGGNATTQSGDTGIDVVVEYRGGSNQSSGGSSDDAQSTVTCYWDADGDGHGNGTEGYVFAGDTCPEGYAPVGDDFCEDIAEAYTEADCAAANADPDADGDGVTVGEGDCNDADATVSTETTWADDADGDGYGNPDTITIACSSPGATYGHPATADDCDDADGTINPGATEVDGDGIDNDCDGTMAGEEMTCCNGGDLSDCMVTTDTACPSGYVEVTYGMTCCLDHDADTYGDADTCLVTAASECSDGYVEGDGDCDDDHYGTSPAEDDPYGDGRDTDCDSFDG